MITVQTSDSFIGKSICVDDDLFSDRNYASYCLHNSTPTKYITHLWSWNLAGQ